MDTKFTHNGERFNNDAAIQPGTGSWDAIFGAGLYLHFWPVIPFANGRYLLTPQEDNGVQAFSAQVVDPNTTVVNSVSDQAFWQVGLAFEAGRTLREQLRKEPITILDGFNISLALAGTHSPKHDLIGGSGGFRRATDALFIEPGIQWQLTDTFGFYINVPVTVYRYFSKGVGTFPDVELTVGMSFAIN